MTPQTPCPKAPPWQFTRVCHQFGRLGRRKNLMSAEPVELSTHLAASGRIFSPHFEVSFEVSKQAHLLDPNFFRFKGLSEGVYRLRPPPPNNGPKTTD
ncbi:hypothetical protein XCCB100_2849 [Xanthomonas campestris pv. campestris]|uniref:Uncharacterized protein n=1 Tax=Xanthomonas campestris pv. campestris (strain B100) TaxID=509169 RepID=B0RVZ2_XANCB|nr:hypothetical protein XCCB100_2849 [Xanthomonas campestris pv. campestris]